MGGGREGEVGIISLQSRNLSPLSKMSANLQTDVSIRFHLKSLKSDGKAVIKILLKSPAIETVLHIFPHKNICVYSKKVLP